MENPKSKTNNLFLLGAGFTKAVFPDAPLNKDLLPILCKGAPSATLKRYYKEHKTNDIEILLTRLDLEMLRPKRKKQIALQQVRKEIERQLAEYFQQFRFGKGKHRNKDWLKRFSKEVFQPNDAIVSINYDCFLEGLLDHYKMWSPINGYPSSINVGKYKDLPVNPEGIIIYKIHGSENFRLHEKVRNVSPVLCGELFESWKNRSYSQIHPDSPYIIAPSFVKIPHEDIERMMIEAQYAAGKAKKFIIIGCGMRPEDTYLWLLLTTFLYRWDKNGRIIIVAPNAVRTKEKINSHYWGGNEVTNVVDINGKLQKEDILDELLQVVSKED